MLVKILGNAVLDGEAIACAGEVNATRGEGYHLIGLPANPGKQANYRNFSGRDTLVKKNKRNTPTDVQREGVVYYWDVAAGMIAARDQVPVYNLGNYNLEGELSHDGSLRPIFRALSRAILAHKESFKKFILPFRKLLEAAIVKGFHSYGVHSTNEFIAFFKGSPSVSKIQHRIKIRASASHQVILLEPREPDTILTIRLLGILSSMNLFFQGYIRNGITSSIGFLDRVKQQARLLISRQICCFLSHYYLIVYVLGIKIY